MSKHREPLTPEEREIADRLARLGASAEPSSMLDARILGTARAAAQASGSATAVMRPRLRRRWPVGIGLAASLALAVGIAWQLRPLPDAGMEYSEAPAAARTQGTPPASDIGSPLPAHSGESAMQEAADQVSTMEDEARAEASAEAVARRQSAPAPEDAGDADASAPAPPEPAPAVSNAPAPTAFPATPAPPPPAPPAPRPDPSRLSSGASAATPPATREAPQERKANAIQTEAAAEADARARTDALDRIQVTGSRIREEDEDDFRDQPYDEQPPASADSPEVRRAWLNRIRELVAAGEIGAARASLQEFSRRYPLAPLPEDLRPLIE